MTLEEMKGTTELPPARVELLVYLCSSSPSVSRPSPACAPIPRPGQLPTSMPSGPIRGVSTASRRGSREPFAVRPLSRWHRRSAACHRRADPRAPAPPASRRKQCRRHVAVPGRDAAFAEPTAGPGQVGCRRDLDDERSPRCRSRCPRRRREQLAALRSPAELGIDAVIGRAHRARGRDASSRSSGVAEGAARSKRFARRSCARRRHGILIVCPSDFVRDPRMRWRRSFFTCRRAHQTLCDSDSRKAVRGIAARWLMEGSIRPRGDAGMREVDSAI